ncbi:helix-turn-helix transcriptional regulator [Demequina activiva]|uniref:HTH luxR-type domain-containing protein n=1 Tax=Demequina activiva TaxID=1582364 RepID=A0A919ULT1_9MICO|nr:helix-turn-helix transcriptional regulator [Demequina activiva]GIG55018.1 hypothetical protein Dac01nite_17700 [Demequina activiva]
MSLDDRDARAVLSAAEALASTPAPDFAGVLDVLRSLIDCDSASFNDMALATSDYRYAIVPSSEARVVASLKPKYDAWIHQHPLLIAVAKRPAAGALRLCDVEDGDRFRSTDLYREFYAPFDISYQLAAQLPSPPDVVVAYVLNRSESAGEFSSRDVEVINSLSGLLALHHRVAIERDRTDILTAEMERNAWAVVSVRSDGMVEASSTRELSTGTAVPPQIAALISSHGSPPHEPSRHEVVLGEHTWQCVIHPVPLGPAVLLLRRVGDRAAEIERLEGAGLTGRQASVLWELARTGGSNGDLARALGVSEGTVKKHLEAVFRTLGVPSRGAAILRARQISS